MITLTRIQAVPTSPGSLPAPGSAHTPEAENRTQPRFQADSGLYQQTPTQPATSAEGTRRCIKPASGYIQKLHNQVNLALRFTIRGRRVSDSDPKAGWSRIQILPTNFRIRMNLSLGFAHPDS
uniref:Uncharacterized protein n=1 Tax=Romanomermis culicivorax TaxID=13658 RepID=A0A915JMD1_ROMCU